MTIRPHILPLLLLLCGALFGTLAPMTGVTYALSCAVQPSAPEEYDRSTLVFRGIAEEKSGEDTFTFRTVDTWKGPDEEQFEVRVSSWIPITLGDEYLVYAAAEDGVPAAHLCGRTGLWSAATEDRVFLPEPLYAFTPAAETPMSPLARTLLGASLVIALLFVLRVYSLRSRKKRSRP
ncbi:hypothetical protein [Paenibacillus mucilaginosus]|uniref:Tissue inhibitor of metalloproteinase n=2 Tax=Paenibacillus mucilaginosus TaxID=61624 RepID=I0BEZ1_9BACL|nr:hypothetical protein [Paenibacillus mucilaginosus]AEI40113.1 hypothetical protein KNP414_01549 [Paenibacillus mucilaginosus KNP414]AFH60938.1 hypothetical protein B2K_09430 [Paenibacillus mucilaginosus K02]MCG7215716.1 hypothetical protein [Paenibacillus mucilaginosus]WDM29347.1 hypothetical protein KCX80_09390 [Paenibacillus mucilaginosus]